MDPVEFASVPFPKEKHVVEAQECYRLKRQRRNKVCRRSSPTTGMTWRMTEGLINGSVVLREKFMRLIKCRVSSELEPKGILREAVAGQRSFCQQSCNAKANTSWRQHCTFVCTHSHSSLL